MNNLSLFFAQIGTGNEMARGVVESSLSLFQQTGEAWQRIFDLIIDPAHPLWSASVDVAQLIMGISLFYFAFTVYLRLDSIPNPRALLDAIPLPLFLSLLITNNGQFLAGLVLTIRDIFLYFLVRTLQIQVAGIAVNDAIARIQNTAIANNRARIIFADCLDKTGTALTDCVNDPVKIDSARSLLGSFNGIFSGNALSAILDVLSTPTSFVASALQTVIASPIIAIIQIILLTLQWAFINIVEAALLLTAISAPIFLAFSLFSESAPLFILWLTNYLGLFFIQLGYVALVGFNAAIISAAELAGQPIGSIVTDLALLAFQAVFAPGLAVVLASGGGILLFLQMQGKSAEIARAGAKALAYII